MRPDSVKEVQQMIGILEDHVSYKNIESYSMQCCPTGFRLVVSFGKFTTMEFKHNDTFNDGSKCNEYHSVFDALLDCNMKILDKVRSKP